MRHPRPLAASVLFLAVLTLVGCSGGAPDSGSITTDVYSGLPDGTDTGAGFEQTTAVWLDSGHERFAIVTWGSSSCPPIATELTASDAHAISVAFAQPTQEICTADMAATTHEFDLPAEVTQRPVAVEVTIQGYDGLTQLALP